MSGTKIGGIKARNTNLEKYGDDFYKNIGRKGGQAGHTGGFAANPALAKLAGAKGGKISRRGGQKNIEEKIANNKDTINQMLNDGYSVKAIADKIDIKYNTLIRKIENKNKRSLNV